MTDVGRVPWFRSTGALATAAVAGAAFVGYAIYFDHKRRSDPNYKQKIRENRRRRVQGGRTGSVPSDFPNPNDAQAMQAFFLREVQFGEELLAEGNLDEGVEHLCNAVVACAQPQQLLGILGQTLPIEQFELLIQK
ncbi:MAS20 protein import receptor containing protein [Aphelenchoides avenae]|nr:MAS20 protein import receptor containing protein [Aphelenchus avenae]